MVFLSKMSQHPLANSDKVCSFLIFQIAARDADIRVLRTDLNSAQKKIKNHSNEVTTHRCLLSDSALCGK